jgi:hypothetical protein
MAIRMGNGSLAKSELLRAHKAIECFLDEMESSQAVELLAQKERAERGFREGRFRLWQDVKRENGL